MSGSIFIYTPQILDHFHFISNPISSVFCLVFFHLITEFELDHYEISSPRSQVRALHFYLPRVNKNKPK